jgi:hypothetical protein
MKRRRRSVQEAQPAADRLAREKAEAIDDIHNASIPAALLLPGGPVQTPTTDNEQRNKRQCRDEERGGCDGGRGNGLPPTRGGWGDDDKGAGLRSRASW